MKTTPYLFWLTIEAKRRIIWLCRIAKFAASMNAQHKNALPFLVLPDPLRFPLVKCELPTRRPYDT